MAGPALPEGFEIVTPPARGAPAGGSQLPPGFEIVEKPKEPGMFAKIADVFTGSLSTQYPDMPEFGAGYLVNGARNGPPGAAPAEQPGALATFARTVGEDVSNLAGMVTNRQQTLADRSARDAAAAADTSLPDVSSLPAVARTGITSDTDAHLDMLRGIYPGLEARKDSHGNVMVRPPGYKDFAYINKPGVSARDIDELGTQTLATAPFLGTAGAGKTVGQRLATGAGMMAAGEGFRQTLEQAAGSEQGYSPGQMAITGVLGGALAPGVASEAVDLAKRGYQAVTAPTRELISGLANPADLAAKRVTQAMIEETPGVFGPMSPNYSGRVGAKPTGDQLAEEAAKRLKDPGTVGVEGLGPDARLFDVMGESGRDLARVSANFSSKGRQTMQEVVNPRFEAQSERTINFIRDLADHPITARKSAEELEKTRHMITAKKYEGAFDQGAGGLSSPILDKLTTESPTLKEAGKEAIKRLSDLNAAGLMRTAAYGTNGQPTLELWDMTKRVIDGFVKKAERNKDTQEVFRLNSIKSHLTDELDRLVPSYGKARGTAEKFFDAEDALDAGTKFASAGRYRNEEVRDVVGKMSPNEKALFERGYIDRVIAEVHEMGERRNVVPYFRTPGMHERMEIALGPDKAEKLTAYLKTEHALDFIRGAFGNSTTARQLAQMGLGGVGGAGIMSAFNGGSTDPATILKGVLIGATVKGAHGRAKAVLDSRLGEEVAKLLVSKDPAVFKRGMAMMDAVPQLRRNLEAFEAQIPIGARNVAAQAGARATEE